MISKVEADEAVLATDAECARSAVSSRVKRLTWAVMVSMIFFL